MCPLRACRWLLLVRGRCLLLMYARCRVHCGGRRAFVKSALPWTYWLFSSRVFLGSRDSSTCSFPNARCFDFFPCYCYCCRAMHQKLPRIAGKATKLSPFCRYCLSPPLLLLFLLQFDVVWVQWEYTSRSGHPESICFAVSMLRTHHFRLDLLRAILYHKGPTAF